MKAETFIVAALPCPRSFSTPDSEKLPWPGELLICGQDSFDGIILKKSRPGRGRTGLFHGLPKRGCYPTSDLRPTMGELRFETADEVREGCYELREGS